MATKNKVTIDGVTYVKEGTEEPKNSNIKIVVLQRGWIMIGRWSQTGENCSLDNAYIIRRWGTKTGLGELALEGKKTGTTLDKAGHVDFHQLTIVATLNCKEELWATELV